MLGCDVDLFVEAALLLAFPVRGHQGCELGELIHLLGRQLRGALGAGFEVGDDSLFLE